MGKGSKQRPTNYERYCKEYERLFGKGGPVASNRREPTALVTTGRRNNATNEGRDKQSQPQEQPATTEAQE